ncbi:uncharacterized protein DUF1858 [Mobilisporobacter senegalensis]|uniref:Uncharacterized protein DUF1858 n=1 Tax=Mobilisporobacter senegalensis TaxID=1329262 RepID=A0A3N1XKG7_9FIRM|nr:DUF1858 domain-containing protein [Mobilisporobacter senegalensis]ROR27215.1 uncharacterized protein DUF1858 [Mobilisporobacter senegalensis]
MSTKMIDLKKTVHDLCSKDQDLPMILAEIGFKDITKPGMLVTAGRFMTIPKGAIAKNIDIEVIKQELIKRGYTIVE